jgi:hypothetical protein
VVNTLSPSLVAAFAALGFVGTGMPYRENAGPSESRMQAQLLQFFSSKRPGVSLTVGFLVMTETESGVHKM